MCVCVCVTKSLCCTTGIKNTVNQLYFNKKKKEEFLLNADLHLC